MQHPEVFMAKPWEIHYFGRDLDYWWWEKMTEDDYLRLFSEAADEKRIGDRSCSYLVSARAAEEIKAFAPDARIIINLRNPIEMLHALHRQLFYNGVEFIEDFEEALANEEDRVPHHETPRPGASLFNGRDYMEMTNYATQVQRYFDIFGRENVHIIIFDDFKKDSAAAYRAVVRFLEIDESFEPEFEIVNSSKRLRSQKMMHPPILARRFARSLMPKPLRKIIKKNMDRINVVHEARKPLNPELLRRLRTRCAPQIEQLGNMIDRDLSHWTAQTP